MITCKVADSRVARHAIFGDEVCRATSRGCDFDIMVAACGSRAPHWSEKRIKVADCRIANEGRALKVECYCNLPGRPSCRKFSMADRCTKLRGRHIAQQSGGEDALGHREL